MPRYLLQTKTGLTPPKYIHHDIDLAITEAKRLHELLNTDVMILQIVGVVEKKEVPVTELKTKVTMFTERDELPF